MEERRQDPTSGRRQGDALFTRGVKIAGSVGGFTIVALTLAFKMYAQAQDFPAVKDRVTALEAARSIDKAEAAQARAEDRAVMSVLAYISCVTFSEKHPQNEVPALCAQSVRNGR